MGLVDLCIQRDGYIKASELQSILEAVVDGFLGRIGEQDAEIASLRKEVGSLRQAIETERRLRRAMGK